jgi:hypothetical protein
MQMLSTHHKKRNLVSIRRSSIDPNSIQGFVVGLSQDLVALEYVYDFQIDGLLVLRRSDITDVRRSKTDEFQQSLLKQEGIVVGNANTRAAVATRKLADGSRSTLCSVPAHDSRA